MQVGERLDVDRAGERAEASPLVLVVELLDAEREDHVVEAGGHHRRGLLERRGGAGARVLDVDDGDAADAHAAQDDFAADRFLAGDQPGGRVADVGGLEIVGREAGVRRAPAAPLRRRAP